MAIPVKLPVFEGPLDLLLHLIDKNKVDIYDIPIVQITDQYMDYIRQMGREDLGVMSEFMVMAATLMDIKCKMLLPAPKKEDGQEEDPRADLVERLLEYKMYKYMSYELKERMDSAGKHFYKEPTVPAEVAGYRYVPQPSELLSGLPCPSLTGCSALSCAGVKIKWTLCAVNLEGLREKKSVCRINYPMCGNMPEPTGVSAFSACLGGMPAKCRW